MRDSVQGCAAVDEIALQHAQRNPRGERRAVEASDADHPERQTQALQGKCGCAEQDEVSVVEEKSGGLMGQLQNDRSATPMASRMLARNESGFAIRPFLSRQNQ